MILKNARLLTANVGDKLRDGSVYIKGDKILDVDTNEKINEKYGREENDIIDLKGNLLIPGLTNPYANFYVNELGLVFKFMESDLPIYEKLSKMFSFIQSHNDNEQLFDSIVKVAGYKSMLNGVTSTISSTPIIKNLDKYKKISQSIGVKIKPSPIIITEKGISKSIKHELENFKDISSVTIFGLWALEDEDYEFLENFMKRGKKVKILLVDYNQEERYSKLKKGIGLFEILKEKNLLSRNVEIILAGKVNDRIMDLFTSKGVKLIKSVKSELIEIGEFKELIELLGRGMKIGFGTGMFEYSLFDEAKAFLAAEKLSNNFKHGVLFKAIERTVFYNNAEFLSEELGTNTGKILQGYDADLAIVNVKTGHYQFKSQTPFTELALKMGTEFEIFGLISDGEMALWDRKPTRISEQELKEHQLYINNISSEFNL